MKKYFLLLLAISTLIAINQNKFDSFFTHEEKASLYVETITEINPNKYCEKCGPGKFWNDFMQWCQPIPGWVPEKDSPAYKRDQGHNLLPYGAQDIQRFHDDVPILSQGGIENIESTTDEFNNEEESTPSESYEEEPE